MNLTGLLRIGFRWRRQGLLAFGLALVAGLVLVFIWPLQYESQITIEREPVKISFRTLDNEFDVTRFTSENQRTIALLRSEYLMRRWLYAIGIQSIDARDLERKLKKLTRSLLVKPINFTDLYLLKVQAASASEAIRRIHLLVRLFEEWDASQGQEETSQLIALLNRRLDSVRAELAADRRQIKREKLDGMLNLSGSVVQGAIESSLRARQELYSELTSELEKAERQLDPSSARRVRIVVPATVADTPIRSRGMLAVTAVFGSLFIGIATVLIVEWQSRKVFRVGDIYRLIGNRPVISVPVIGNSDTFHPQDTFGPLMEVIHQTIRSKGSAVVQVISPGRGDGKSAVCEWLQRCSAESKWRVCILETRTSMSGPLNIVADQVQAARKSYEVILLELPLPEPAIAGGNLSQLADISCVVVGAGKTSCDVLPLVAEQIKRIPQQSSFFVLNRYHDPLPENLRI